MWRKRLLIGINHYNSFRKWFGVIFQSWKQTHLNVVAGSVWTASISSQAPLASPYTPTQLPRASTCTFAEGTPSDCWNPLLLCMWWAESACKSSQGQPFANEWFCLKNTNAPSFLTLFAGIILKCISPLAFSCGITPQLPSVATALRTHLTLAPSFLHITFVPASLKYATCAQFLSQDLLQGGGGEGHPTNN